MPESNAMTDAGDAPDLLDVWVDDHLGQRCVGTLERRIEAGHAYQASVLFHYHAGLTDADAISLLMPIRRESYLPRVAGQVNILPPIFDQNIPEGALRNYLIERYRKVIPDMGDFDLLRLIGRHGIGRVRAVPHGASIEQAFDATQEIPSLDTLLTDPNSESLLKALLEQLAPYSGVSGVQPKVLVATEPLAIVKPSGGSRLTLPAARHIVKSAAEDYPWLTVNEHLCLYAANMAGLNPAGSTLSDDGRTLAVERFDIDPDGKPLGFEDGCSLAGQTAAEKFKGSYETLVQHLTEFLPREEQGAARETLFRLIALNCLLGNGDAHLKNFGLLYADPTAPARLAPAFDLVCTTAYLPQDQMALTMQNRKDFPSRTALERFGRQACRLTPAQIETAFNEVATGMEAASIELAYCCGQYPDFAQRCGQAMQRIWRANMIGYFKLAPDYELPTDLADLGAGISRPTP